MAETPGRLLRLLSLLQTPRAWNGAELAARLEVTSRTVRNDIERLRRLGYPVVARRGAAGGYRLDAGAQLPPLLLEDDEAVAIIVGLRGAAAGAIPGIEEISMRTLTKLERVLPARLRRRVTALQLATVATSPGSRGPAVDPSTLAVLAGACLDHERLTIDYRDHAGTASQRGIEPQQLVSWARRWYLLAWDLERHDWRTFRVDRVTSCLRTGAPFPPRDPPAADAGAYVVRRVSAAAWRHRIRITIQASAEAVASRLPPWIGTVEPLDEHRCVLVTGSESIDSTAVWIGVLDLDFTVTEPPELLAKLRELSARYDRAAGVPGRPRGGGDPTQNTVLDLQQTSPGLG